MNADQVIRSKVIETGIKEICAIKSKDEVLRIEKRRMEVLNWFGPGMVRGESAKSAPLGLRYSRIRFG
ncbi:uncharacterized protein LAJ45_02672 [Morchella importuna]|uniref:uncharacterized protein n=1 Tax=Morchella importuna TaxID=1174673 RepID=UPI001E8D884C|nr:uncharacterized protein LAJ45_02672 [Morchella importuna]KAH8153085.1 hypothetical protein LAJ45_02672 [Morchella importuna]